ncbi:translation initiation factor IF-2-like [Manacus candei]|uniref:translation initiation factor IF-2-like n=1 Tax=Manacus candei TaxID=415023 RepID=UPI002225F418|nr:translation initiation factor IF-2-like [Manacus candei]
METPGSAQVSPEVSPEMPPEVPPEVSPASLEPLVAAVAALHELGAALGATAGDLALPPPCPSLRGALVAFGQDVARALRPPPAFPLSAVLTRATGDAAPDATGDANWPEVVAAARAWQAEVAAAEAAWAGLSRRAAELGELCQAVATAEGGGRGAAGGHHGTTGGHRGPVPPRAGRPPGRRRGHPGPAGLGQGGGGHRPERPRGAAGPGRGGAGGGHRGAGGGGRGAERGPRRLPGGRGGRGRPRGRCGRWRPPARARPGCTGAFLARVRAAVAAAQEAAGGGRVGGHGGHGVLAGAEVGRAGRGRPRAGWAGGTSGASRATWPSGWPGRAPGRAPGRGTWRRGSEGPGGTSRPCWRGSDVSGGRGDVTGDAVMSSGTW